MQKYRSIISGALLVATLVVVTGCDMFKPASCPSCKPDEVHAESPGDVLLTIDGRPAITKQKFEELYELAAANAGPYGGPSKREIFKQIEAMAVLENQYSTSGKDQTVEYKKELARAYDHARWGVNTQLLAKELQEEIDVSEAALSKLYAEQLGKNQAFDRPPFLKSAESVTIQSVEFADKAAADAFLEKAKTNFAGEVAASGLVVKDLGAVSALSEEVDFAIRLKARTIKPGEVEVVQAADKFYVIKAGGKKAQYATFAEIKAMPQVVEYLSQLKSESELESVFMDKIEQYKKSFTLVLDEEYFKADDEQRKVDQEKLMELFEQQMKAQQGAPAVAA